MSENTRVRTSGSRDSLRHLDRVGLEVEPLPLALKGEGLTRAQLFGLVRERLERGSIQILSRTGALHLKGAPTLFLAIFMSEYQPGSFLYGVALELVQGVRLERLSTLDRFFAAPTWRAQVVGLVDKRRLSLLPNWIGATADAFASARTAQ